MAITTGRRGATNPLFRDPGILSEIIFTDDDPESAGFLALVSLLEKEQVKVPEPSWGIESYLPNSDTASAGATAAASMIPVTNVDYFIVGDVWFVDRTDEQFRVTSVDSSGGQVGVIRGIGALNGESGTAAAVINSGDNLYRLATAVNPQRSGAQTYRSQGLVQVKQYTQAFRYEINVGRESMKEEYFVNRNEWDAEYKNAKREAKIAIQRQFMFGQKSKVADGSDFIRTMQGIYHTPTTYEKDFSGILHKNDFDSFLAREAFRWGSKNKVLMAGDGLIQSINQAADGYVEIAEDKLAAKAGFGFQIRNYTSQAGTIRIVEDRSLSETRPYDGVVVDMNQVKYQHFSNKGIMDDLHVVDNSQDKDATDKASYIYGQVGLNWGDEKTHARIKNADKGARGSSIS